MNRSVNERQLELLRRIANDGPLGRAESEAALSVYALRSRGLVATKSERHYWTATITDNGRFLLEHGHVPDAEPATASAGQGRHDQIGPRPTLGSPVEIGAADLIERVQAAGGELRIPDPSPGERSAWGRAIHAAGVHPGLPAGMRLRHRGRSDGPMTITLANVDQPAAPVALPERVPVPDQLVRPHAFIVATRAAERPSGGWIDTTRVAGTLHVHVSPQASPRALRIAEGLIREAERRGHTVVTTAEERRRCAGGIGIAVRKHPFELNLVEETDRQPHAAVRAQCGSPWAVDPKTEAWLAWAGEHADSTDPLLGPLYMPDPPEATPAALQPFLAGWSPYGPHSSSFR